MTWRHWPRRNVLATQPTNFCFGHNIFTVIGPFLHCKLHTGFIKYMYVYDLCHTSETTMLNWDKQTQIVDHPRSGLVYNFNAVCLSVCMSVCQTITLQSLDVGSSFSHIQYVSREYWSSAYMKVVGSRSKLQKQKGRKCLFPQCKTSIGNNSGSIKHIATKFACSIGFSAMADRMVFPPSLSRDRKWPRVTKCRHLREVDWSASYYIRLHSP